MLDRLNPSAEDMAKEWIGAFDAALAGGSEIALSELFVSDSHWRNLFGISWHFATFSGHRTRPREMLQRAADARARGFRIDTAALTPRHAVVAGREIIEAVICFDTAEGPGIGALRLLPAPSGRPAAWTISAMLDFDKICAARSNHAANGSQMRDFAGPDWSEQRQARSAYGDRDPDVLIVGGGHAGIAAAVELKRIGLD